MDITVVKSRAISQSWPTAKAVSIAAAICVAAGGAASALGWAIGSHRLMDWTGEGITIKFNAAAAVTCAGLALLMGALWPERKTLIRVFVAVTAVIAAATLTEHIFQIDIGIDTLFFDEAPGARATAFPGRMGLPASLSLTALGAAFVLATFPKGRRIAAVLSIVTLLVAALSLIGYTFGADRLYSLPFTTGIAFHTALLLAVLAIGSAASIPEHGVVATMSRTDAGGITFRRLIVPIIVLPLILGWLRVQGEHLGYYDSEFGTALRTLIEVYLLAVLLWWTAENLSLSEKRSADASRLRGEIDTLNAIADAQESERRRIARDLHDHLGQALTGLRLRLKVLSETDTIAPEAKEEVEAIRRDAARLDNDISLLAWAMRPNILDDEGLAKALRSFSREWSAASGVQLEFQASASAHRFPSRVETNLYRIAQEALNNILKHANAREVLMTLNFQEGEAVLMIQDDGAGFDPEVSPIHSSVHGGLGLVGMRERAALLGGTVEIESAPGEGATVFVRIPAA